MVGLCNLLPACRKHVKVTAAKKRKKNSTGQNKLAQETPQEKTLKTTDKWTTRGEILDCEPHRVDLHPTPMCDGSKHYVPLGGIFNIILWSKVLVLKNEF